MGFEGWGFGMGRLNNEVWSDFEIRLFYFKRATVYGADVVGTSRLRTKGEEGGR